MVMLDNTYWSQVHNTQNLHQALNIKFPTELVGLNTPILVFCLMPENTDEALGCFGAIGLGLVVEGT